ncbi:MAG: TIGR03905 family TSCPD domain-containing protein [Ruminococcus sp.]|nr:TIGR03905 family TSCPD domain-containing protein [Ruminococcus sp.]MBR1753179.1 TIGR03905 family TSCPD domain-containing protein [Ruminococcus sp.]
MAKFSYMPSGVCSRMINIDINDDGVINDVQFIGGCHGNTQGVAVLAKGMQAEDVIERLKDIDCKGRGTSCPAQLALALEEALEQI